MMSLLDLPEWWHLGNGVLVYKWPTSATIDNLANSSMRTALERIVHLLVFVATIDTLAWDRLTTNSEDHRSQTFPKKTKKKHSIFGRFYNPSIFFL